MTYFPVDVKKTKLDIARERIFTRRHRQKVSGVKGHFFSAGDVLKVVFFRRNLGFIVEAYVLLFLVKVMDLRIAL